MKLTFNAENTFFNKHVIAPVVGFRVDNEIEIQFLNKDKAIM